MRYLKGLIFGVIDWLYGLAVTLEPDQHPDAGEGE
jgi:hypothetical protein